MSLFVDLVPAAVRPTVDWPRIDAAFDWFERLYSCLQDPVHHAEGNVGVHTSLVVEALLADPVWPSLGAEERTSLFWAGLLHDVAKPDCTRIDADGRVTAPGHSRRGQIAARAILWRLEAPFRQREHICHLVTHHQLPFHVLEGKRPQQRVHRVSLQTRCDLLAILATADALGRECRDRARLMDNVELFRELCREEACFDASQQFASPHSRFLYFRSEERDAAYEAFDDWRGEVILMSGLPAAGKDFWLSRHADDADIVSLDALRRDLGIEPDEPQARLVAAARERLRVALRGERKVIWNATNLSRSLRASLIDLAAAYRAKVRIVYVETSEVEALNRNARRERPVPQKAIAKMLQHWEVPDITECHKLETAFT